MKVFGFAVIASLLTVSSASADSLYLVKLAQPVPDTVLVSTGLTDFRCTDSACYSVPPSYDAANIRTCHKLAQKVGEVVSYGEPGAQFNADALARCNQKD